MAIPLRYSDWRTRLRSYLSDKQNPLDFARMVRYALIQGPWQPWLIRHYERHDHNPPLPVRERSLFPGADAGRTVEQLERDAFTSPWSLPGELVDGLVEHARALGVKRSDDPHETCEAARRIALDPEVVRVARGYLGAEPILNSSKLYWTAPPKGDPEGQRMAAAEGGRFHYDLADLKALTLFVYLTDVDSECGPHVVIRGTQGRKTVTQVFKRFLTDEEVARRFPGRMHVVTGRRGTAWFEDISCFHKQAAARKPRLMLSIIYSLHRPPLAVERRVRPAGRPAARMLQPPAA